MVIRVALSLLSTTVVTAGLGFVFWAAAAHLTSAEVVGRSSAVISAMQLIATFGTLGLHTLLIAELPNHDTIGIKRLVVTSAGIATTMTLLIAAAYAIIYRFAASAHEWLYANPLGVALFGIGTALTAVTILLDGALIGVEQSGRQVSRNFIFALTKLLALPLAAFTIGLSPQVVFAVWMLGNIVSLLLLGLRTKAPQQWVRTMPSLRKFAPLWRTAAGHHWINVATQAPRLAMPIMVATQLSDEANAGFYAALLLISFIWIVPNHLATGMFALHSDNQEHFARGLDTALRYSAVIAILAAALTPFLARPLLSMFGSGYESARFCLIALAACTFASAIKSIYIAVRRVEGALGKAARAAAVGSVAELGAAELGLELGAVTGVGIALGIAMVVEAALFWPVIQRARRRFRQKSSAELHRERSECTSTSNRPESRRSA